MTGFFIDRTVWLCEQLNLFCCWFFLFFINVIVTIADYIPAAVVTLLWHWWCWRCQVVSLLHLVFIDYTLILFIVYWIQCQLTVDRHSTLLPGSHSHVQLTFCLPLSVSSSTDKSFPSQLLLHGSANIWLCRNLITFNCYLHKVLKCLSAQLFLKSFCNTPHQYVLSHTRKNNLNCYLLLTSSFNPVVHN